MARVVLAILALCAVLSCTQLALGDVEVQVEFYEDDDLDGDSSQYKVIVGDNCSPCIQIGDDDDDDHESYRLTASANYTLTLYYGEFCDGRSVTLNETSGNIPDDFDDDTESFKVCPQGRTP